MKPLHREIITTFEDLINARQERYLDLKEDLDADSSINVSKLDTESINITRIHGRWNQVYNDEYLHLDNAKERLKKVRLERWKYYLGKQSSKYYADYGNFNEEVLRTDADKYVDADDIVQQAQELVNIDKAIVSLLDRFLKELSSRNFHIKNAIDYRKFLAGE